MMEVAEGIKQEVFSTTEGRHAVHRKERRGGREGECEDHHQHHHSLHTPRRHRPHLAEHRELSPVLLLMWLYMG